MPPPCSRRPPLPARRRAAASAAGTLDELLARRIIFVTGKGGTGKTTIAAAIALLGARARKQVLAVEVEPKGDLATALGSKGTSFKPELAQPNLSFLALHPEESFQEYLHTFFKVPGLARATPLAKVFDFIATAVPGPRDMLVVGKVAFEERRRDQDGSPTWDLIVVDFSSTGHVLSQLNAARSLAELVRGGMIRSQVEWIDGVISDARRTGVVLTSLPEEMPVVETLELYQDIVKQRGVHVVGCVLNRVMRPPLSPPSRRLLADLATADAEVRARVPCIGSIGADLELAERLHAAGETQARRLRDGIDLPVVEVPLLATRHGLATSRAVATVIAGSMAATA
ncbi:MAG TPA: ArsA-related P-loop ATPase [Candidatus Dormibacteraeota bacterium]|jgi:anion-transporting  ArsA/GET3 family ATPase|nr:ArsA-related P-loop ATPase [Candidatus Dormibacteraeota bacterium]